MKKTNLPKVAIVGRPNVGKSSLFNRIVGTRKAIVESQSGTTRDRVSADIHWKGKAFTLTDTAGFDVEGHGEMAGLVLKQIRKGIEEADMVLFVTDGTIGIMPQDREIAQMLRKASKKMFLVVNKIDRESDASKTAEFFELGIGEPYGISAMHARGIERLCNDLVKCVEKPEEASGAESAKVAIIGRPNVGKSSYLNSLLSEERVIVHSMAGTTRDAIDTDFNYKDRNYLLIDTAGIRHNAKISKAADYYGSVRSGEAISRSDVAVLLIDGYEGLTKDDARIIDIVVQEGKALIIAVNKWDLVKGMEMSKYKDRLIENMKAIRHLPVLFMSCKSGRNVQDSLDVIWSVYEKSRMIIPKDKLIEALNALNDSHDIANKRIQFKSFVQDGISPLSFVLDIRNPGILNENLKRFIENFFRKTFDFEGLPIRIHFGKKTKGGKA